MAPFSSSPAAQGLGPAVRSASASKAHTVPALQAAAVKGRVQEKPPFV